MLSRNTYSSATEHILYFLFCFLVKFFFLFSGCNVCPGHQEIEICAAAHRGSGILILKSHKVLVYLLYPHDA